MTSFTINQSQLTIMQLFLSLIYDEAQMGPLVNQHKLLRTVANYPVLGQVLEQMRPLWEPSNTEVILVGNTHLDQIKAWVRQQYPKLNAHFVQAAEGQSWLWAARDKIGDGPLVLAKAESIVLADFAELAGLTGVEAAVLVSDKHETSRWGMVQVDSDNHVTALAESGRAWAGILWLASGARLREGLSETTQMGDVIGRLLGQKHPIVAGTVHHWLDVATREDLLRVNNRLLAIGYNSQDALERSYTEEFAVIPPVFIHESAEIVASVIGPYASVGAGAVVEGCVVQNSILEAGAQVRHAVLDGAYIGHKAEHTSKPLGLVVDGESGK